MSADVRIGRPVVSVSIDSGPFVVVAQLDWKRVLGDYTEILRPAASAGDEHAIFGLYAVTTELAKVDPATNAKLNGGALSLVPTPDSGGAAV